MDLKRLNKFISIFKEAQVRRRIIPPWAKTQNIVQPKEKFPGFLADIDDGPSDFSQPDFGAPDLSGDFSADNPFTPGNEKKPKAPKVNKTINDKLKEVLYSKLLVPEIFDSAQEARNAATSYGPDAKVLQLDYMTQAWAPKISKWVLVSHDQNDHEVKTAYVTLLSKIYSNIQNKRTREQDRKSLEDYTNMYWENANKNPENTGYKQTVLQYDPEEFATHHVNKPSNKIPETPAHKGDSYKAFEQLYLSPKEDLRDDHKQIQRNIREESEAENFGQGEERLREIEPRIKEISQQLRSLLVDTKPYEALGQSKNPSMNIKNKLDKLLAEGKDAKMVKIKLPKTPYGEELIVWYLAKQEADPGEIATLLVELQKLRANKMNITNSIVERTNRLANYFKLNSLIKKSQDSELMKEEISTDQVEKKTAFEAMEESMLNEAKSKATPLEKLVQMTRLKRKFAIPAMMTFIEVAEKTQEPQFDYARDILNGRIPKFKDFADEYKALNKILKPMSENDIIEDREYNTISRLFTLWNMVLAKFNRDMAYDPLPVLRNKKPLKTDRFKQDEAEPIFDHPAGQFSRNISNPKK